MQTSDSPPLMVTSAGFVYVKSSTEQVGISSSMVFVLITKLSNEINQAMLGGK